MPIPLIAMGVSSAIGAYGAHKQGQVADAQTGLANKQSALANEMASISKDQYTASIPALNKAMQHYMTLAVGSRGQMQTELAPDLARLMESYKGAQRGVESKLAPGPGRDQAIAEMSRQKVGQAGLMPFQARSQAFGGLQKMGDDARSAAFSGYGGASGAYGNAMKGQEAAGEARMNQVGAWSDLGKNAMSFMYPWLLEKYGKGKGGGMGSNPTNIPSSYMGSMYGMS